MPSNRQLRVLAVVLLSTLVVVLYLSSDSRRSISRDFYASTVQRMEEQDAEEANARMAERVNHGDSRGRRVGEEKVPKPAHVHDAVPPREQEAVQQKAGDLKKQETGEEHQVEQELGSILKRSPIIIFSKTYCPHSKRAKAIFLERYKIVPAPFVVELDEHPLGPQLQAELERTTGRRTVPNVLISGKSIGGGDDVAALDARGELVDKVRNMAGRRIMEASLQDPA
ncbi:MAG: hypothetical protein M1815_003467 [Lichina confinis]|nr:MAG: hypothetical protein M1815_003467 [Lichina confinis]